MHQISCQIVLSRTKADLTEEKGCLLLSVNPLVPSSSEEESDTRLEELLESTAKTGWRHPSGCSKLTTKVAEPATSLFNLCLKFYEEKTRQKFGTKYTDRQETARERYERQGIRYFAKKCLARQKRRGKEGICSAKNIRVKDHYHRVIRESLDINI